MLKRFEVSGFKNFEHKITLDFSDIREYKFNNQCLSNDLLSKIIIYGKNSIGKTNIGLALFDIESHLTLKNVTPNLYDYYLNSNIVDKYAEFSYQFKFNSNIVDYTYKKDSKRNLIYEKLSIDSKLIFEYDHEKKEGETEGLTNIAPTLNWTYNDVDSILRYVINNTVLDKTHPLSEMINYVSNMLWFRSLDENRYIGYKTKSDDYYEFIFDKTILKEFENLLHRAGIDEKLVVNTDGDGIKRLYFAGNNPLPFFKVASSGTKALYTFFYWYKTARDVSLMFIDEFDAFYHFELAETIVSIMEKMKNTQVILT